ncbi:MAG: S8 family serine peptidase, partial [Alphaproteobacteria bacterium]|nr:S8 family serine peptidase [Alphaproteobacteria bacterium]
MALSAALLLGGCGGGGVSPAPYVSPCPSFPCEAPTAQKLQTPDDMEFENRKKKFENSPEYQVHFPRIGLDPAYNDRHKAQIKASAAYARDATGKGEVVAVSDLLINPDHPEFGLFNEHGTRIGSKVTVVGPQDRSIVGLSVDHGSAVASLIAGNRDETNRERNMHGIAFDATLVFRQVDLRHNPADVPNMPNDLNLLTEDDDKELAARLLNFDYARAAGAGIINQSFGMQGHIDLYAEELVRAKLKHVAAALEQKGVPHADKIIVVRGAGNEGNSCFGRCSRGAPRVNPTSPALLAGLGVYFPELQGHVLAVAAVGVDGLLEDYSNPCGSAKVFCLAAPGDQLASADTDPPFITNSITGTSGATALVSGSLALLRQYFRDENGARQLGSTELTARLLATADRTGTYANSDKYGHGLLDLDAATAPVGQLMTSLSTDPNAQPFNPAAFSLSGNAFGGAMRDALGGVKIAAFDELDAPFFFPLADGVSHAPQISAGHSDTLHEHEVALGGAANASLALSLAAGELSAARIRR